MKSVKRSQKRCPGRIIPNRCLCFNKESRQEDKVSSVLEVFFKELMTSKILAVEPEPHIDCHHLSYSSVSKQSGLTNYFHLVVA